jgi:hypothetical protein
LRAAAALAALQGLAMLANAGLELFWLTSDRLTMGTTTAVFFAAYGAALLLCARGLLRARSWARSPLVFAQLIWLGVAWSFRGGQTTWVAVLLAVVAVAALVGLLHPASTAALDREP